jgi:SAM-dependent methyltransferase
VSYKVYMLDALGPIEWSQAEWRIIGSAVPDNCEQELIHDVFLRWLPRDGLIADAGCGSAKWTTHLRQLGYRMIGIDLSPEATAIARSRDRELPLLVADTRRTPIRDHALDAVISLGVVEHEESGPIPALRELHRVLKPGGILVLDVPYNSLVRRLVVNPLHRWVTHRRRRANWRLGFSEYRFSGGEIRGFLRESAFEILGAYPNDCQPPKNVGLWVDYTNLIFDPFFPPAPDELFVLPRPLDRVASVLIRRAPWLACGMITFVARAR